MFASEEVLGLVGRIMLAGVVSAGFWTATYFALKAVMPKSVSEVPCIRALSHHQRDHQQRDAVHVVPHHILFNCFLQTGRKLHNNDGSGAATAPVDDTANSGEGALRAVTIVYAAGICILAAISNLWIGPWAYSSVGEENTHLQVLHMIYKIIPPKSCVIRGSHSPLTPLPRTPFFCTEKTFTLQLSLGYFIFDLSWSLSAGPFFSSFSPSIFVTA